MAIQLYYVANLKFAEPYTEITTEWLEFPNPGKYRSIRENFKSYPSRTI